MSLVRKSIRSKSFAVLILAAFCSVPFLFGAGGKVTSPTGTAPDRYVYYPGTEALENDEIRMTACGTGLPAARRGVWDTSDAEKQTRERFGKKYGLK